MMSGRKHKLYTEIESNPPKCKKIRLESMLERLSLGNVPEENSQIPQYQINPLLEPNQTQKRSDKPVDFDSIISASLAEAFKDHILQGLALIRYAHPFVIVISHFQSWVKRLFNQFVRKFNKRNHEYRTIRTFKDFSKIIALTRDTTIAFTYRDLINIVLEENAFEAHRLRLKRYKVLDDRQLSEIKDEEELAREGSYTYWDRMAELSKDMPMEDYEMEDTEGRHVDEDMMDGYVADGTPGCKVEANYGNYYETGHAGFHTQ